MNHFCCYCCCLRLDDILHEFRLKNLDMNKNSYILCDILKIYTKQNVSFCLFVEYGTYFI